MELSKEQIAKLNSDLPNEALKQHPSKTFLTTINPAYVIERMNEVFGVGNWQQTIEVLQLPSEENKGWALVKSELHIEKMSHPITTLGGNNNADPGDALKGAQTDALTKACSYLGIGLNIWKDKKPETPITNSPTPYSASKSDLPWLNKGSEDMTRVVAALTSGKATIADVKKKFKLSKAIETELTTLILEVK